MLDFLKMKSILSPGDLMKIEQEPLSESVGCLTYFGTRRDYKWLIEKAHEDSEERDGTLFVTKVTIQLRSLSTQKTRSYGLHVHRPCRCHLVIWAHTILQIEKSAGSIHYIFEKGRILTVLRSLPQDNIVSLAA